MTAQAIGPSRHTMAGPQNIYVDKAALNGNPIDVQNRAIVDWDDLKLHTPGNSAVLEFWMKSSN